MTLSLSCSGGQKPSKGNTCLDTDWFLFIGAVIKWLRHPHYPEMKLKDPGRALPSVWLLWSQTVCISSQGTCHPVHAKKRPTKVEAKFIRQSRTFSVLLVNPKTGIRKRGLTIYRLPVVSNWETCCCATTVLTTTLSAAKPGPQLMALSKVCKGSQHLSEKQKKKKNSARPSIPVNYRHAPGPVQQPRGEAAGLSEQHANERKDGGRHTARPKRGKERMTAPTWHQNSCVCFRAISVHQDRKI